MPKYIGQKKITEYNEMEGKVQFTLDDGSGDIVTKDQFDSIVKDEKYDDGMVRVFKWNKAVSQIMKVLLENDMRLIEKDFVMGRVDTTIVENYRTASAKLFGAKDENLISLSQINKVLIGKGNDMIKEKKVETPVVEETPAVVETPVVEETAAPEVPVEETPQA